MANNILVPIDAQEPNFADKALRMAVSQAQEHQATLHILTVIPGFNMPMVASYFPDNAMEQALKAVEKKLIDYISAQVPKQISTELHIKNGNPFKQILKLAKQLKAEMIVLPGRNHSRVDQVLIGSVAAKVVERAACSVLVVRD